MSNHLKFYINGQWVDADSGKTIEVTNPATGEVIGTVPQMGAAETKRAIDAANAAWGAWRKKTAKERAARVGGFLKQFQPADAAPAARGSRQLPLRPPAAAATPQGCAPRKLACDS